MMQITSSGVHEMDNVELTTTPEAYMAVDFYILFAIFALLIFR